MGKINMVKVLVGGVLAGLVISIGEYILNETILGADWQAAMQALNKPAFSGSQIAWFLVLGFLLGILAVWTYAAIRPRFGAGPKTAVCAGLIVWALAYAYPTLGWAVLDFFPAKLIWTPLIWGLVELPVATVAGAWLYKES